MYTGRRYGFLQTVWWSREKMVLPLVWAAVVTAAFQLLDWHWVALPILPITLTGTAVAFYLGFKNNGSYDRLWEARKVWGGIVNASRSWAIAARDLVSDVHGGDASAEELQAIRRELVLRHVAWLDALRHLLRKRKSWEHQGERYENERRWLGVVELSESLLDTLSRNVSRSEAQGLVRRLNPPLHVLSTQSRRLSELRARGLLDSYSHVHLQQVLDELYTQQGKAERIKNFPFPRQYASVNSFFVTIFTMLLPSGMIETFEEMPGEHWVWLTVPFATVVSWVFLTTDKIGDWSENPFEGLHNDVPITSMCRGIERDLHQMLDAPDAELPPGRPTVHLIQT